MLLPGASRIPSLTPYEGSVPYNDHLNQRVMQRSDWVMGPNGIPVISGSSEWHNPSHATNPQASALAAALATQQGAARAAAARAADGLAALEQYSRSAGPTIGGHDISAPAAMPLLQALGIGGQETEAERQRRLAREMGLGVA